MHLQVFAFDRYSNINMLDKWMSLFLTDKCYLSCLMTKTEAI